MGEYADLAIHHVVDEILDMELLDPDPCDPDPCDPRDLLANWFSLQSTTRVHDTFLALGQDMSGMLSRSEFSETSNRTMSPLFIQGLGQGVQRQAGGRGAVDDACHAPLLPAVRRICSWEVQPVQYAALDAGEPHCSQQGVQVLLPEQRCQQLSQALQDAAAAHIQLSQISQLM
ncbi:hypothetical protein V8C86DRAFT_546907 [Haematococcus lacustris]